MCNTNVAVADFSHEQATYNAVASVLLKSFGMSLKTVRQVLKNLTCGTCCTLSWHTLRGVLASPTLFPDDFDVDHAYELIYASYVEQIGMKYRPPEGFEYAPPAEGVLFGRPLNLYIV